MDKNTILGFTLILLILIGFSWLNKPSEEQIAAQRQVRDSIERVAQEKEAALKSEELSAAALQDSTQAPVDSVNHSNTYGNFAISASGEETFTELSNEVIKVIFSSKGGQIHSVELKDYKKYDGSPLIMFDNNEVNLNLSLLTANNRVIHTSDMYFVPVKKNDSTLVMRLFAGEINSLDIVYSLKKDNYMMNISLEAKYLDKILVANTSYLDLTWKSMLRQQEKGRKFEARYTGLYYKNTADDVEYLSESSDDSKSIATKVRWIGYKDQFFSSVLIAEGSFTGSKLSSKVIEEGDYLKEFETHTTVEFDITGKKPTHLQFYCGPNSYPILKTYDEGVDSDQKLQITKLVPLGASVLRWINIWLTIPIFEFLGKFISSYGIIILILTFIIKLLISPLTHKSYMSSARMRVVKPMIDKINEKYKGDGKDVLVKRQQETMSLYKRAGINPMSGCIPMLLQMPILFALFMFFPSSIELRQQPFLWAEDLSSYDAVITWTTNIPLISGIMGNHISLFCLLMTVVQIAFSKYNMEMGGGNSQQQMPGMKMMMYVMPLMFFFIFNQYSSGLSWYYLVSTLFGIAQTFITRKLINEDKLLLKIQENMKKPVKKSGFAARLEEAQKAQQKMMKEKNKRK